MQTLKRSIILQISVFGFFFLYGLDNIIKTLVKPNLIYNLIELLILLSVLGFGFYIYRKTDKNDYVVINKKQLNGTKYALYAISIGLILSILLSNVGLEQPLESYLQIFASAVIAISGVIGTYIGFEITQKK